MKIFSAAFITWIKGFFVILGVIFFSLILRVLFTNNQIIVPVTMIVGILTACVFSLAHVFISTDCIVEKMSVKTRLLICLLPCSGIAGVFSHHIGLTHILGLTNGTHNLNTAILGWVTGLVFSVAIMLLAFFLLERHLRKTGQRYDQALRRYKDSI